MYACMYVHTYIHMYVRMNDFNDSYLVPQYDTPIYVRTYIYYIRMYIIIKSYRTIIYYNYINHLYKFLDEIREIKIPLRD